MRSLLTMLGIIIGVAAVIAIITLGNGGREYLVGMIRDMGQSTMNITARGRNLSRSDLITKEDVAAIKELESVQYVSPMYVDLCGIKTENNSGFAMFFSGNQELQQVAGLELVHGTFFTREEYEAGSPVVLIDTMSAMNLFGYEAPIGEFLEMTMSKQTVRLRIIGVVNLQQLSSSAGSSLNLGEMFGSEDMMPSLMALPITVVDMLRGNDGRYDLMYLTAHDENLLDEAGGAAVNMLYSRHNNYNAEKNVYQLTNMATFIDLLDAVIRIFTLFVAAVSAISLVVGGIGVMNIMLVSVTERTREIGIRKALGAKTGTILLQFLTESVILCAIGGTIGLIIGVTGALSVAAYINIPIRMQFSTIAIAVGFSSAIGIFFGIYPARRAAKMHPIEALRRD